MIKTDWYMVFLYFIMMSVVGFIVFDNIISKFIFAIAGGVMGWILNTKKATKKNNNKFYP